MTTPINLNRFRKSKARADKDVKAGENRAKFGRTKARKQLDQAVADKSRSHLDGHKRDRDE